LAHILGCGLGLVNERNLGLTISQLNTMPDYCGESTCFLLAGQKRTFSKTRAASNLGVNGQHAHYIVVDGVCHDRQQEDEANLHKALFEGHAQVAPHDPFDGQ
jgi:hypothetical protein